MKLSLRNLALCGSLMLAGAAMAQTPTVKLDWQKQIKPGSDFVYNDARDGAGFADKFYFTNKTDGILYCYDHATDAITKVADVPGCSVGVTTDDAGNILVNCGFPNASSSISYYIVSTEGEVTELAVDLHEVEAGRADLLPRVVGNLLSEEGAIFYVFPTGATAASMVYVQNGQQADGDFSFFTSATTPYAGASTTLAQPRYSFEELVEMGDDAVNACALKARNNVLCLYEGTEWSKIANIEGAQSSDGFDVFTLGDVEYRVVPTSTDGKYNSTFSIADMEGNIIYTDERGALGTGSYQNGANITARKINENTVEIYTWYQVNSGAQCAKFTVSLPAEPAAPLYVCGAGEGLAWEPATPMVVNPEADGSYKFTISNLTSMKISSVAGSWDDFNTAALFFVPTAENLGQEIPVEINGATNIDMPWTGDWTITISADKTKAVCTTTTPQPIGAPDVYIRGAVNGWNAPGIDNWKFECNSQTEDQYIYMFYCGNDKGTMLPTTSFKIADANWGQINYSANKKIAAAEMVATNQIVMQYNANDMSVAVPFQGTLEFRLNKDLANKNGVVLIFHPGENLTTAVEAIEVEEGEAVYYNLQGVKVANPENGMYLKVVNGKASKVLVK